jgi:hypothetical protein
MRAYSPPARLRRNSALHFEIVSSVNICHHQKSPGSSQAVAESPISSAFLELALFESKKKPAYDQKNLSFDFGLLRYARLGAIRIQANNREAIGSGSPIARNPSRKAVPCERLSHPPNGYRVDCLARLVVQLFPF